MPDKTEKLHGMTQKLTEDVKFMKTKYESRISHLEKSMEELKGNLRNLVEIRKEAMSSSVEGLKKVNKMIVIQKAWTINKVLHLVAKSKKKNLDPSS